MPQINIEVDEATASGLDRAAAARALNRPAFVRQLFKEALRACADGRELFASESMPGIDPAAVPELLAQVAMLSTELDRVLTQNAKRDAALQKKTAAEDAEQVARITAAEAGIKQRLVLALDPFRASLGRLHDAVLDHPRLTQIDDGIRRLETSVRAPPPADVIRIEGLPVPTRWWHWPVLVAWLLAVAFITQMMLTRSLPDGFGVRIADRLLAGDAAFHQLATYRYGHDICAAQAPPAPVSGATCKPVASSGHAGQPYRHSR